MNVERIAAFSDGEGGGNPAGVIVCDVLPPAAAMQEIAAQIGYSESVFAAPTANGDWRVRYFAPHIEIPFCGHATIALGAALTRRHGDGIFNLQLNDVRITVEGHCNEAGYVAALQSPPTRSEPAPSELVADALALFSYSAADLDQRIPMAVVEAGARHVVLALNRREQLSAMRYAFDAGRALMTAGGFATISLIFAESPQRFHARNPFAVGGVYEDPATGAAAAALAGYLRDLGWPHNGVIDIVQGEDMGMRSCLRAEIPPAIGGSIRVSGAARIISSEPTGSRG